ncbi:hypothetical protein EKK58_01750 [Candidatus Dependentiae bacterium]|nr:MAG: hypothetical protein EKK58_01750 [Candidatus Dependentiae bacterium]
MSGIKTYTLLVFSALLYALPALYNTYFWWCSFLFLLPFFYVVVLNNHLSYKQAYVWSFFANAFHLAGICIGIVTMAEGPLAQALFVALCIICYAALFGLSITFIAKVVLRYVFFSMRYSVVWSYIFAMWIYFLLMDHVCMMPFDVVEGYFLLHPVLPLVVYPSFVRLLPWLHGEGLCAILLTTQASLFGFLYDRSLYWKKFLFVCMLFWLGCLLFPVQKSAKPVWFEDVVTVPYVFRAQPSVDNMVQLATAFFKDIIAMHNNATIFLMPEASFYYDKLAETVLPYALTKQYTSKPIHLLTGAFAWDKNQYRNTLYWFYDGNVQHQFHKKHAMVLTERTPSLFRYQLIHDLYFKNMHEIVPSDNERPVLNITDQFTVVPYICSELFFAKRPRDCFKACMIYALCNDRWTVDYVKLLMLRVAQYKAIEWNRCVVYVSFAYQYYIDPAGAMLQLQKYTAAKKFNVW